jgi:hypothetical protein
MRWSARQVAGIGPIAERATRAECLPVSFGLIPPLLRLRHRADAGYLRRSSPGKESPELRKNNVAPRPPSFGNAMVREVRASHADDFSFSIYGN